MRKVIFILAFVAGCIAASAQQINDANVQKRAVGSFHGIKVETGIKLYLTQGNAEEVAVSASTTELRDKIVTKVENGILILRYEPKTGAINKMRQTKGLKAYVSYKTLTELNATSGAEVELKGVLNAPTLNMIANTGATINGEINSGNLTVKQNTGSKISLSGKVQSLAAEGSTGSKLEADEMETVNCNIDVSTGAKVTVIANKEIKVKASTGAVVKYKGNASVREIKSNTGGTVSKI